MGKTYRTKRPKYNPSENEVNRYGIRDGVIQHNSRSCRHGGSCGYCRANRTFNKIKTDSYSFSDLKEETFIEVDNTISYRMLRNRVIKHLNRYCYGLRIDELDILCKYMEAL